MTEPVAGQAFAQLIVEQLTEERARKTSLEGRGLALITTSGAFTTLVLAISALTGDGTLPGPARALLILALVCFFVAAVLGVLVNLPADYREPSPGDLLAAVNDSGDRDLASGERSVARVRIKILEAARGRNKDKAERLLWGAWAQIAALLFVASAGLVVLL